jgi:hypothetical protein
MTTNAPHEGTATAVVTRVTATRRTATIFPLLLALSSCVPAGNFLLTGKLEDPAAASAASKAGESGKAPASVADTPASVASVASVAEKAQPFLPLDTRFSHGQWHLQRTARALYGWTGAGDQFRLFAIELAIDETCWFSRHGDRPEARHCRGGDAPLTSIRAVHKGQPVENVFSAGFDKAPWKTTGAETALTTGTFTLPDAAGEAIGHVEATADAVIVRTGSERGQRTVTLPAGSDAYLVDGRVPDGFDGCASENGTIPILDGLRVQVGKKTCDLLRDREGEKVTLSVAKSMLTFSRRDEAPNLAEQRAKAATLRKSIVGKAPFQLEITGDATRTVAVFAGKRSADEGRSGVEVNATIEGVHYRCEAWVDRFDPAWAQSVKRICASMTK